MKIVKILNFISVVLYALLIIQVFSWGLEATVTSPLFFSLFGVMSASVLLECILQIIGYRKRRRQLNAEDSEYLSRLER